MRPITSHIVSALVSALAMASVVGAGAAEARPAGGGRHGVASVRPGGVSARRGFGPTASLGRFGRGRGFDRGSGLDDRRRLDFAGGYGGFGYGVSGYYGYGGYAEPGTGYGGYGVDPYGPLVVPGYGGIREAPVLPPAIYVIGQSSASRTFSGSPDGSRSSASGRLASRGSATLASAPGRPERAGPRIIEVRRVPR